MPGAFKIRISGDQKEKGGFDKLFNLLEPRIKAFAPDSEIEVYTFARLSFRYVVTGVPERFDLLDNLAKSMQLRLGQYIKNWEYKIEVKFVESG